MAGAGPRHDKCFLEADAPRVECKVHGVVVAAVPWARHDAWFTRFFDDQAAWLAVNTSKTAICQLMRIAWRTVGVSANASPPRPSADATCSANLTELGFDEISIRKGQKYLTVVVDHHTGRLVWAHAGRDRKTVEQVPGSAGRGALRADQAVSLRRHRVVTRPVAERCPDAVICLDPFHVVKATTDALDEVRRAVWNEARRAGKKQLAKDAQGRPLRAVEEPGEADRPPTGQARSDPEAQRPDSTAPTCSKSSCARSTTPTRSRTRSSCSTAG